MLERKFVVSEIMDDAKKIEESLIMKKSHDLVNWDLLIYMFKRVRF